MSEPSQRVDQDRCPALVRPFSADDGAIVRVRLPGGRITIESLCAVMDLAVAHGAGVVQTTSRGNLQVRGLPDPLPQKVIDDFLGTGLFPSQTHEQARNILAWPPSFDLHQHVSDLDAAIQSAPELAALTGRFLFVLGPVNSPIFERFDIGGEVMEGGRARIRIGPYARELPRVDLVTSMVAAARDFLAARPDERCWNVPDLPADSPVFNGLEPYAPPVATPPGPGLHSGGVLAGIPLGMLTIEHVNGLVSAGMDEVVVTPWRSVWCWAADPNDLIVGGLDVDGDTAGARVSACIGAPSCRRTTSPTLPLAQDAAELLDADGPRLHIIGCERQCGAPAGPHLTVLAPRTLDDVRVVDRSGAFS